MIMIGNRTIRKTVLYGASNTKSISQAPTYRAAPEERKRNNLAPLFALSEGGTHCFPQRHKANFVYKFMPGNLSPPLRFSSNSFGVAQAKKCTILRSPHLLRQAQALKNKLPSPSPRISALEWSRTLKRGAI